MSYDISVFEFIGGELHKLVFTCVVDRYVYVEPDFDNRDSDWDYYGYTDFEWHVEHFEAYSAEESEEEDVLVATFKGEEAWQDFLIRKGLTKEAVGEIIDEVHEMLFQKVTEHSNNY